MVQSKINKTVTAIIAAVRMSFLSLASTFFKIQGIEAAADNHSYLNKKLFNKYRLAYQSISR